MKKILLLTGLMCALAPTVVLAAPKHGPAHPEERGLYRSTKTFKVYNAMQARMWHYREIGTGAPLVPYTTPPHRPGTPHKAGKHSR